MRPPQEAHSLLLRATQGCAYNRCLFCNISRGYSFMWIPTAQLEMGAMAAKAYYPPDTRIYLTGSNPLYLPARQLEEYLAALRRQFPLFSRVSMQARIADVAAKSLPELFSLREMGLSHLYLGVENGNDKTLVLMKKGQTARNVIEQAARLDMAGISYTMFYVLGLGGKGMGGECGVDTADMFNQTHPARITTTGLTIFPNSPLSRLIQKGKFEEASEREKIEELAAFLAELKVDTIYDGIHYLNPLNYVFRNTDAAKKSEVLADIQDALATMSDAELELMVNRKQMTSL